MLKKSLYFSQPTQLTTKNEQLCIQLKDAEQMIQRPIEDLGFVVLDHAEIYISPTALEKLVSQNVAVIFCNQKHLPSVLTMPLESNTLQSERFSAQISASIPLKKQLWKQVIEAKINNQASALEQVGQNSAPLKILAQNVKSGDSDNREAQAARYYWSSFFSEFVEDFYRDRYGFYPNNLLNYGYAILRAAVARALVGSGLLPTLGIHHHNRYNAYCLADDLMEPYRPCVDRVVWEILQENPEAMELNKQQKAQLLNVLNQDVVLAKKRHPLQIALGYSTASLAQCFLGERKTLKLATLWKHKS